MDLNVCMAVYGFMCVCVWGGGKGRGGYIYVWVCGCGNGSCDFVYVFRQEEHTPELQTKTSLSYAVTRLTKTNTQV